MSILLPLTPLPALPEPGWQAAPAIPHLPVDEIHIWRARLDACGPQDGLPWTDCPVVRDRSEQLQLSLFRKNLLERYTPPGWDTAGASIISGPASGLEIVIARCEHLALMAVSRAVRGLGLDVERVREDIPFEEMAGGFLDAPSQWDLRITWSPQEKAWKFFRFWTTSEACDQARPVSRASQACHVRGFSPELGFVAALASQGGPEPSILYWDWNG
jgi:hypothetical protein